MDIESLRKYLIIAETENLQLSAKRLNTTAGALSKLVQKLEADLNTRLFDRQGRGIALNIHGKRFVLYASHLVHEYQQVCSEFKGSAALHTLNISGPAILTNYFMPVILEHIDQPQCSVILNQEFEGDALNSIKVGRSHLAIITQAALSHNQAREYQILPLFQSQNRLMASACFLERYQHRPLIEWPFACPTSSPFCGIERGMGNDSWSEQQYPRTIRYQTSHFENLLSLVKQGFACAYLPDFILTHEPNCKASPWQPAQSSNETLILIWQPTLASGWLNQLTDRICAYRGC